MSRRRSTGSGGRGERGRAGGGGGRAGQGGKRGEVRGEEGTVGSRGKAGRRGGAMEDKKKQGYRGSFKHEQETKKPKHNQAICPNIVITQSRACVFAHGACLIIRGSPKRGHGLDYHYSSNGNVAR